MHNREHTHILFDLDNTLCRDLMSTADVIAETLRRCRWPIAGSVCSRTLGERYDQLWLEYERCTPSMRTLRERVWASLLAEHGADTALAGLLGETHGRVRGEAGVALFHGVRDLLAALRTDGLHLGMLTNGHPDGQWPKIRALEIEPFFDAIIVAGDVSIFKPDVRVFDRLLSRLGARADRAVFVGDSYTCDIVGAHAAGMQTVWVSPDRTSASGTVIPDATVPSVLHLREVLR